MGCCALLQGKDAFGKHVFSRPSCVDAGLGGPGQLRTGESLDVQGAAAQS